MLVFCTKSIHEIDYIQYNSSYDEIILKKDGKEIFTINNSYKKLLISYFTKADYLTGETSQPQNLKDIYKCIEKKIYENGKVKLPI